MTHNTTPSYKKVIKGTVPVIQFVEVAGLVVPANVG